MSLTRFDKIEVWVWDLIYKIIRETPWRKVLWLLFLGVGIYLWAESIFIQFVVSPPVYRGLVVLYALLATGLLAVSMRRHWGWGGGLFNARSAKKALRLISKGANVNDRESKRSYTPLHVAAEEGRVDVARVLIEHGAQINDGNVKGGYTPLHLAAMGGHVEVAKHLVERGANVNKKRPEDRSTPLHIAAGFGNAEIANCLIIHGADMHAVSEDGFTPLHYAAIYGRAAVARLLREKGARKNYGCVPPLILAAQHGHAEVTRALLETGSQVNEMSDGWAPLHEAAYRTFHGTSEQDYAAVVKVLIEHGADVNIQGNPKSGNFKNYTALHFAISKGQAEIAKVLVKHGASLKICNGSGETPLHMAAWCDHANIVRLLVDHGANLNAKDAKSNTPLMVADKKAAKVLRQALQAER